jgi:hypothetical protein
VRAVEALKALEKKEQPLEMPALQLVVLAIDRMGDGVGDLLFEEVLRDGVKIAGDAL